MYRTHHCRASVTRNQPEPPAPRPAEFWKWVEQAKHDRVVDDIVARAEQASLDFELVEQRVASQNRGGRP